MWPIFTRVLPLLLHLTSVLLVTFALTSPTRTFHTSVSLLQVVANSTNTSSLFERELVRPRRIFDPSTLHIGTTEEHILNGGLGLSISKSGLVPLVKKAEEGGSEKRRVFDASTLHVGTTEEHTLDGESGSHAGTTEEHAVNSRRVLARTVGGGGDSPKARAALLVDDGAEQLTALNAVRTAELALVQKGRGLWIGPLGSCYRSAQGETVRCTPPSFEPKFDFSGLSTSISSRLPTSVPRGSSIVLFISLLAISLSFFLHLASSLPHLSPSPRIWSPAPDSRAGQHLRLYTKLAVAVLLFGWTLLLGSAVALRIVIGKTVNAFDSIWHGLLEDALVLTVGTAFHLIWTALAFLLLVLAILLTSSRKRTATPSSTTASPAPAPWAESYQFTKDGVGQRGAEMRFKIVPEVHYLA